MTPLNRRQFMKYGLGGIATLIAGSEIPWGFKNNAHAAWLIHKFTFTDAIKDMVVSTPAVPATCYFWCFKDDNQPLPSVPGPLIVAKQGDIVCIKLTNALDEPHAFFIPGLGAGASPIVDSGPIPPGGTKTVMFVAPGPGTYLYFDNLNAPVNRVMGLHGALIVMTVVPAPGNRFTPYSNPTPNVQKLFNDLGSTPQFPGLAWEQGDPANGTAPFRQWIYLLHQADADLFGQVASLRPGVLFSPTQFVKKFFPNFFTITGESSFFAHEDPTITPHQRVGEPGLLRILNAGLHTHSLHMHANHVYVLSINNVVQNNLQSVDTFSIHSLDRVDWLLPFVRPQDVPQNAAGEPLATLNGGKTWPPVEELNVFFETLNGRRVRQSPLEYPMHDHQEYSNTTNGGNYSHGMLSGMIITGDRTLAGGIVDFPGEFDVTPFPRSLR